MKITEHALRRWRENKYRRVASQKIRSEQGAEEFINECGIVMLFDINGIELPNLWNAYSRPWRSAWDLKQTLPARHACVYAKVIHKKGTFISWDIWPCMFSMFGAKVPYERAFREGYLTETEKRVLDVLNEEGPLSTHALRKRVGLPGKKGTRDFHRALTELQSTFRVTAVGGDTSRWTVFDWDLVGAFVPDELLQRAHRLDGVCAMNELIARYVDTVGVASPKQIARVFRWDTSAVKERLADIESTGRILSIISVDEKSERNYASCGFIETVSK